MPKLRQAVRQAQSTSDCTGFDVWTNNATGTTYLPAVAGSQTFAANTLLKR